MDSLIRAYMDAIPATWWLGPASVFALVWLWTIHAFGRLGVVFGWMGAGAIAIFGVMIWGAIWPIPTAIAALSLLRAIGLIHAAGRAQSR